MGANKIFSIRRYVFKRFIFSANTTIELRELILSSKPIFKTWDWNAIFTPILFFVIVTIVSQPTCPVLGV
jgi:hypothetical protein